MTDRNATAFEKDRALVEAMRDAGEPVEVIDDFLLCLDRSDAERDRLREIGHAPALDMASGDVIGMNPLTSQPQRATPRS